MNINDLKFPQYLNSKNKTVTVCGIINNNTEFVDGKGYVDDDGYIWVYCQNKPMVIDVYPYIWIENDEIKYSTPSEKIKNEYSIKKLKDLSLVKILDSTEPREVLLDKTALQYINTGSAFYVPTMNDSDDFLKKLVKSVILKKGIDINGLKAQTGASYVLANMKSALESSTKMSVKYFLCWMELLNCDFELSISSDDDTYVVFDSRNGNVVALDNDGNEEIIPFK